MTKTIYEKPGVLEITRGWDFNYKVMQYHDQYTLILSIAYLTFFIRLANFGYDFDKWNRSWGCYYFDRSFWLQWGEWSKSFYMPWSWKHVRHEVMYPEGLRKPPGDSWDIKDGRIIEKHPYKYTLENGEVQERIATVYIDEREWRWRWLQWLSWPGKISRCIDVAFDDEVGEKTGTWKGGTIGCGYEMKREEDMLATLRRMESERRF